MNNIENQEREYEAQIIQERNMDNFQKANVSRKIKSQPNKALGFIMLIFAFMGLIPGIGLIVRGTLKLQQKLGHPKDKHSFVSKIPGNIPNVISMFFTKKT